MEKLSVRQILRGNFNIFEIHRISMHQQNPADGQNYKENGTDKTGPFVKGSCDSEGPEFQ